MPTAQESHFFPVASNQDSAGLSPPAPPAPSKPQGIAQVPQTAVVPIPNAQSSQNPSAHGAHGAWLHPTIAQGICQAMESGHLNTAIPIQANQLPQSGHQVHPNPALAQQPTQSGDIPHSNQAAPHVHRGAVQQLAEAQGVPATYPEAVSTAAAISSDSNPFQLRPNPFREHLPASQNVAQAILKPTQPANPPPASGAMAQPAPIQSKSGSTSSMAGRVATMLASSPRSSDQPMSHRTGPQLRHGVSTNNAPQSGGNPPPSASPPTVSHPPHPAHQHLSSQPPSMDMSCPPHAPPLGQQPPAAQHAPPPMLRAEQSDTAAPSFEQRPKGEAQPQGSKSGRADNAPCPPPPSLPAVNTPSSPKYSFLRQTSAVVSHASPSRACPRTCSSPIPKPLPESPKLAPVTSETQMPLFSSMAAQQLSLPRPLPSHRPPSTPATDIVAARGYGPIGLAFGAAGGVKSQQGAKAQPLLPQPAQLPATQSPQPQVDQVAPPQMHATQLQSAPTTQAPQPQPTLPNVGQLQGPQSTQPDAAQPPPVNRRQLNSAKPLHQCSAAQKQPAQPGDTAVPADVPAPEEERIGSTTMVRRGRRSSAKATTGGSVSKRSNVTLKDLIDHGIMQPGFDALCAHYKNKQDYAELLPDGRIRQADKLFESPSAFSVYSKRKITPDRKSDDGWRTLKYQDRQLDHYKQIYLQQIGSAGTGEDGAEAPSEAPPPPPPTTKRPRTSTGNPVGRPPRAKTAGDHPNRARPPQFSAPLAAAAALAASSQGTVNFVPFELPEVQPLDVIAASRPVSGLAAPPALPIPLNIMPKLPPMPRKPRSVAAAQPKAPKPSPSTTASCPAEPVQRSRRDVKAPHRSNGVAELGHMMMELESYSRGPCESGGDAQPFAVDIHPVVLAGIDVHAHLCQDEIIGVFGGRFDADARRIVITRALAVKEGVLDVGKVDVEMDPADQSRAIEELRCEGLRCVGWYHSHPTFPVLPSSIDVYNQHTQQVAHSHEVTQGLSTPYVAAIVGPFDHRNTTPQSHMSWFYVENRRADEFTLDQAPESCLQHMVPKLLITQVMEDATMTVADILAVCTPLIEQYASYTERTDFRMIWRKDMTNLQKMISSVFHTVRTFLSTEDLKEVGVTLIKLLWTRWYEGCEQPANTDFFGV